MQNTKSELCIIPYCMTFDEKYIIEDDMNLLINNMKVYGCKKFNLGGQGIDKQINFEIKVINNKKVIYPLAYADSYLLFAERLVYGIKLETNADKFPPNLIYKYVEIPINPQGDEAKALWKEIKQDIIQTNRKTD